MWYIFPDLVCFTEKNLATLLLWSCPSERFGGTDT
jgi:hypothetical protein